MNAQEASWVGLLERAAQLGPDPDLAELDDHAVEREVRDGASRIAALTCRWLLHVAELVVRGTWADQGARTPAAWLSWACGTSPTTAREYVRVGMALRTAPQIRARFADGTISYSKVRAITRVATPELEPRLLALADAAPAAELERIIADCRGQLTQAERWQRDPADPDDPTDVRDFRRLDIDPDTVEFRIRLPRDQAAAFEQRVDRLVDLTDRADGTAPADRAPLAVRRTTAIADALATVIAAGPPDRSGDDDHLVVLHADLRDLAEALAADLDDTTDTAGPTAPTPADTVTDPDQGASAEAHEAATVRPPRRTRVVTGRGRGMAIPASMLARLTCDADLRLAGIHDHDQGCTHPADIGRRSRKVPTDLRRALQLRDRRCRFPGCTRSRRLHAHHVWHWALGGPTDLDNLVLLCAHHHRFVHDRRWTMRPVDPVAGRWTYHAPGRDQPLPAALALPGASAETGEPPPPRALQPAWWDGTYDHDLTIQIVATALLEHTGTDWPFPDTALAA